MVLRTSGFEYRLAQPASRHCQPDCTTPTDRVGFRAQRPARRCVSVREAERR